MIGVSVVGTEQLVQRALDDANSMVQDDSKYIGNLYSHILAAFQENKDHKENVGVNMLLLDALRAYNGEYGPAERAIIQEEGGSDIFMNLTSTKVRAASAWIKDIMLAEKEDAFEVQQTPSIELPEDIVAAITDKVTQEFETLQSAGAAEDTQGAAATIKEMQERKRDLFEAIHEELNKESQFAFKIYNEKLKDTLMEGDWRNAISSVIDDFCIFPTAILKGPIVTHKVLPSYVNGQLVPKKEIVFMNKRISPFDAYPAPEACSPAEGNFIELMRLSRKEVAGLKGLPKYKDEAIRKVLANNIGKGSTSLDAYTEDERADQELKDNAQMANKNIFRALHFFGTAPVKLLRDWGVAEDELMGYEEDDEVEIEAIVIGTEVVKAVINDDPLGRRPYHVASFQKRPGSFWGFAPPYQMRDIQRMCNACARSLATNMGMSSGPIMELNVERLADGTQVKELKPRDIVQVTSDPAGGSGRAIQFFNVPSNAAELLGVYEKFELRADQVTMIPQYVHGGDRNGGAAQTASGLSMLLESASKGIKDAIRHLDEGIIIPRIESEFYHMILKEEIPFSGDIRVIAKGSSALTLKGAEQMRRNEFLQVTANPIDQEIMGIHGRAQILRKMSDDLGLGENIIPGRQELKANQAKKEAAAAQNSENNNAVQMVQMQTDAQREMAQMNAQVKMEQLNAKREKDVADIQLRVQELERQKAADAAKATVALQKTQMETEAKAQSDNKQIALSLETNDKMN